MIDTPYILDLVTAPVGPALTIQEMQAFGYVVEPDQFGVLGDCIDAATKVVEGDTGRQLLTATYDVHWRRFPGVWGELVLPRVPVTSVTSVKYYDTAGTQQTLSSSLYTVNDGSANASAYIIPAFNEQWPATRGHDRDVTVRFVCGYGDREDIPKQVKLQVAILAMGLFRERMPQACGATSGPSMAFQVLSQFNRHQEFV